MVDEFGFCVDFVLLGGGSLFKMRFRSRAAEVELAVAMGLMVSSKRSFLSGVLDSLDGSVDELVYDFDGGCSDLVQEAFGRAMGSVVGIPTLCTSVRRVLMLASLYSMKSSWKFILAWADLYLFSIFS